MTLLFFHGWHSAPGGVKPTFLGSTRPADQGAMTAAPPTKGATRLAVDPRYGIEIMLPGH